MNRASDLLRPFRAGYFFGGFNGLTWMMTFGTPMVLLLERLGGSAFQIGLTSSFVFILYPLPGSGHFPCHFELIDIAPTYRTFRKRGFFLLPP